MKSISAIALASLMFITCGCSAEKPSEPSSKVPALVLSLADKENLAAFQSEVLNMENLTGRTLKIAGDELKNVMKGGETSISLPAVIDKAKVECLKTGDSLAKKAIPESLPPEAKILLNESKTGLIAAYKAYAESFDAIRSFTAEKNPMALLEYRKKNAEAQQLLNGATEKLKQIMTAAEIAQ
jgi:hypothetical protein